MTGDTLIKQYRGIRDCPKCGWHTIVTDSRDDHNGHFRRRRVCHNCKHRYTTYEVSQAELQILAKVIPRLTEVGEMIDKLLDEKTI